MGLINLRDLVAFPTNGDNTTDTVINGIHFNRTVLEHWNYTLYSNNTISNVSNCYLIFDQYQPAILSNGTFVNGTSCYVPILPLKTRGRLGAIFGALFGISIMFTLINLKKHGSSYLREDRRFRLVGRRWLWYWLLFVGACGLISCVTGIDVDRNYLQDLALILQSFFFVMMGDATVAAVWEGVRHWGSWQERQIIDPDPYALEVDDRRGRTEFYMPLIFYLFTFMSFFLTAPRSWSKIPDQGGAEQQNTVAKPAATDGRFKAGAILLGISWFIILYCMQHNIYYYRPRSRGVLGPLKAFYLTPLRFLLAMIAIAVRIGYGVAMAWNFDLSIMKYDVAVAYPFALGYAPCVLVIFIFNVWGFRERNEDKQLIRQRAIRGAEADAEIGITKKPSWWSKARGDAHLDDMARLRGLVDENAASQTAAKQRQSQKYRASGGEGMDVEMKKMLAAARMQERSEAQSALDAENPFNSSSALGASVQHEGLRDRSRSRGRPDGGELLTSIHNSNPRMSRLDSDLTPGRRGAPQLRRDQSSDAGSLASSTVTGTTLNAGPTKVRSMLDI